MKIRQLQIEDVRSCGIIKAKDLAAEMTAVNVQQKDLYGQSSIEKEYVDNHSAVRDIS